MSLSLRHGQLFWLQVQDYLMRLPSLQLSIKVFCCLDEQSLVMRWFQCCQSFSLLCSAFTEHGPLVFTLGVHHKWIQQQWSSTCLCNCLLLLLALLFLKIVILCCNLIVMTRPVLSEASGRILPKLIIQMHAYNVLRNIVFFQRRIAIGF